MKRPLATLPQELGDWSGAETPLENSSVLYGDEHLHRVYRHRRTGQTLTAWMIYTEDGRDRAHHPEVCMRAIGCAEVREQRSVLPLPGHNQPVQRFFFQNSDGRAGQQVYYWYYVFREPIGGDPLSIWQRLLERAGRKRSGMTVEIFAPHLADGDVVGTDDFVQRLDHALQACLPEGAVRGSLRGSFLLVGGTRIVDNTIP
jgi:EpsI family protein